MYDSCTHDSKFPLSLRLSTTIRAHREFLVVTWEVASAEPDSV